MNRGIAECPWRGGGGGEKEGGHLDVWAGIELHRDVNLLRRASLIAGGSGVNEHTRVPSHIVGHLRLSCSTLSEVHISGSFCIHNTAGGL